jgi:hypothetical protein
MTNYSELKKGALFTKPSDFKRNRTSTYDEFLHDNHGYTKLSEDYYQSRYSHEKKLVDKDFPVDEFRAGVDM